MWENRKPGVIVQFPIEGKVTKLIIQIQKYYWKAKNLIYYYVYHLKIYIS